MPLSDLGVDADRIEGRIMNVFFKDVGDFDGDTNDETKYRDAGIVRDVTVNLSPNTSEADTSGREKQLTVGIEVSFVMQQTGAEEFRTIDDITGKGLGNGHTIICTTSPQDPSVTDVSTVESFTFENVFPNVEGEINGSGEGSYFTVTFSGTVLPSALANVPDTSTTITVATS